MDSSPFSSQEHDSCGVGFVATRSGACSHDILQEALNALRCVEHRGACGADLVTGDGSGIMADIPFDLLGYRRGEVAVATLFMPPAEERMRLSLEIFEKTFLFYGLEIAGYREIPVDRSVLGEEALRSIPAMRHAIIRRPRHCRTDASFDRLLYTAKQAVRSKHSEQGINKEFFFTSLSGTTIVYKALTRAGALDRFYLDLNDPRFVTRFALFHRRFSTNTRTSWDKAQPFRLIAHNGEINTIAGNRSRAFSREKSLGLAQDQLVTHSGISDSGSLNEMVEALMNRSSIPQIEDILAIMMPPAHGQNDFYKFWSRAMEPWDGPAIIMYSDGRSIGARLDRNGFRPSRWAVTDGTFYLSSEAGAFAIDESRIREKGILHAGTGVKVDLVTGRIHFRDPSLSRENRDARFDPRTIPVGSISAPDRGEPVTAFRKTLFTLTQEELERIVYPMAAEGKEPIGSMGDTARPNVFSSEPRPFFDYFYQNFAQVTNPPLDYLREKNITDLRVFLGRRPNIFFAKDLVPLQEALELPGPVLSLAQMRYIEALSHKRPSQSHIIPLIFPMVFEREAGVRGFRPAVDALAQAVLQGVDRGASVIILSDEGADYEHPPIPGLIGLRAVVRALNESGLRLQTSIVVHTGEARTPHHIAALISFGASAVCPYLALEIVRNDDHESFRRLSPEVRERNYLGALESGLLKIMSKSGISVVQSYMSAKLFTAIGLGAELMDNFFPGSTTPLGGIGYDELAQDILEKTALATLEEYRDRLLNTYQFREHTRGQTGEKHAMTAARAGAVHKMVKDEAAGDDGGDLYRQYLAMGKESEPVNIRHLFDIAPAGPPVSPGDVEPAPGILARFGSGAMSFGAVSAESQRDVILAMRSIGGRSNSGEGGENPYYEREGISATTKQVASARFGVTAEYLLAGRELQIKIAQGAKPGEGGQLMGVKVDADIARARRSLPHVDLISPPPLHDVYSIEDLKELIYELKQVHPEAKVSVKLVSGSGIGTIAVGSVKAGADILYIAGGDGGTGAATLGSMKHAGLPWEFGLMEAHRALCENGLRGSVELRTDGGLSTGKDVVIAAILGAEGYDFGKLLLVAEGCIMARICEKNTCPTGIATHDPKFKAKYKGRPEYVARLLRIIAADARRILAGLGVRRLQDIVGRTDLLRVAPAHAEFVTQRKLSVDFFTGGPPMPIPARVAPSGDAVGELNRRILNDAIPSLGSGKPLALSYRVSTADRGVLATLSGEIARRWHASRIAGGPQPEAERIRVEFNGSAGQGFCVFLVDGMHVVLNGEANDSVCKSMSGGEVVIRPEGAYTGNPAESAIIGHCALYGATGGALFVHGLAGDRFGVRNSGAVAVVEGTGLHACEYMTRGIIAILGPVSHNVGAGMTGGAVYLRRDQAAMVNTGYIIPRDLVDGDRMELHELVRRYWEETSSDRARAILAGEDDVNELYFKCVPRPRD